MIAIIICMHGNLGIEMLKTIKLIIGKQKNIKSINFLSGENTDNIIKKYKKKIKKLKTKKGIMFFVDILGGSPFNAANSILHYNNKIKGEIISGTNIPMLLEVLISRKNKNINELTNIALNSGKEGINITKFNKKK